MTIPKNKSHQFRYSEACQSEHTKRMHDSVKAMLSTIGEAIDVQFAKGNTVYNLEPLTRANGPCEPTIATLIGNKVYDFDKANVEVLESFSVDAEWRPFILNDGVINWIGSYGAERDIDVLHIGGIFPRRKPIIDALTTTDGITFLQVSDIYGEEATALMKRAKVVVNIHRDSENQAQEQLRIAWAIGCGCTVVSEESIKPSIPSYVIIESTLNGLYDATIKAVKDWTFADSEKRKAKYLKLSEKYKKEIWKL